MHPGAVVPKVVVVADQDDLGVRAAARAAALTDHRSSTRSRIVVVAGDDLAAARWSHHVATDGRTRTTIGLPADGGVNHQRRDVVAVLFRSQAWRVPTGLRGAPKGDVDYAWTELTALFVSWLASLGPRVFNALEGGSPWGLSWSPERWRQVSAGVGLPVAGGEARRRVLVAGRQVVGARDNVEAARCRELAVTVRCRLLEISFTVGDEVSTVSTVPALADPAHVAATTALLCEAAA